MFILLRLSSSYFFLDIDVFQTNLTCSTTRWVSMASVILTPRPWGWRSEKPSQSRMKSDRIQTLEPLTEAWTRRSGTIFLSPSLGDFLYHEHIYFRNSDRTPIPRLIAAFNLNNASRVSWWYHYQNDFPTPRSFAIPNRIHGSAHLPSCTKHYHHRRHVFHNKCRGYSGELLVDHNRT